MSHFKDNLRNQHGGLVATWKPVQPKHEWDHSAKVKITNEQVRELRILHEVKKVPMSNIIKQFRDVYDVKESTLIDILNYHTRLSPKCEINYTPT